MKIFALLAFFALASCQTFKDVEGGLNYLVGSHIKEAISVIGYPNNELNIAGDKVYVWQSSNSGSYTLPNHSTNTGYIGSTPFSYTEKTYETYQYNNNCEIRIITDQSDIIETWEYKGNQGGCTYYSKALANLSSRYQSELSDKNCKNAFLDRTNKELIKSCRNWYEEEYKHTHKQVDLNSYEIKDATILLGKTNEVRVYEHSAKSKGLARYGFYLKTYPVNSSNFNGHILKIRFPKSSYDSGEMEESSMGSGLFTLLEDGLYTTYFAPAGNNYESYLSTARMDKLQKVFSFPFIKGESNKIAQGPPDHKGKIHITNTIEATVEDIVSVRVPYGEFKNCAKINLSTRRFGTNSEYIDYICEGTGLVKRSGIVNGKIEEDYELVDIK